MSGEGLIASDRGIASADFDSGRAAQRVADAGFLEAYAARLRAGPRRREAWEPPINPNQHDSQFASAAAALIEGLASSIRAGLAGQGEADNTQGRKEA